MKSKLTTTALLIVLPFFITACSLADLPLIGGYFGGSNGGAPAGPVTLNIWGLWINPDVMAGLITKYRETHPNVTINYDDRSVIKMEDYKETVYTRATQEDAPDIVFVHNTWVKGLINELSPAPAGVITPEAYAQSFYPVAAESALLNNNVYALPVGYDGLVLVYNMDHFEEIDQASPPTAWEEFRKLALALTIRNQGSNELVRAGAAIGSANNIDFFSDILGLMFSQAKVSIPEDLDSKPAQDALTFYTNFIREDKVWSTDLPEASAAFAAGRVSMILVPSWNLLDIVTASPDLNIGVAPVPQALPSDPTSWASFWMTAVPAGSKNKDAAWEFMKFLSENEQQLSLYSGSAVSQVYGMPYSSVELKAELDANPYLRPVLDQATFARTGRIAARSGNRTAVAAMQEAVESLIDPAKRGKTIDVVMKTAKDTITNTR